MPTGSDTLCAPCGRFMHTKRNGVIVEEVDEREQPYKLWRADLLECPECHTSIVTRFAHGPFAEHYEPDYEAKRAAAALRGSDPAAPAFLPFFTGRCRLALVPVDPRD